MPQDRYRSDDMGLVTWLKTKGHTPQDVRWEGDTCYWYFLETDLLIAAVEDFMTGVARVEPRGFNKTFGRTKREFFDAQSRHH